MKIFKKTVIGIMIFSIASLVPFAFTKNAAGQDLTPGENKVSYLSEGETISALVYVPADYVETEKRPAIVITRPAGGIKEQTAGLYAEKLSGKGFVTLAFDPRGFGESEGRPQLENPYNIMEDTKNSVSYIRTLPQVDPDHVFNMGICAGTGYAAYATALDDRIKGVALVSPSLIFNETYLEAMGGGANIRQTFLPMVDQARKKYFETGEETFMQGLPETEEEAQAPGVLPVFAAGMSYYLEGGPGDHPNWRNQMNVCGQEYLLTFSAFNVIHLLNSVPVYMVYGTEVYDGDTNEVFFNGLGPASRDRLVIEGAEHFELYWKPEYVDPAVDGITDFFNKLMPENQVEAADSQSSAQAETTSGTAEAIDADHETYAWRAIPYAKPPVGDLRWAAPWDPDPWTGVRREIEFCDPCTQYDNSYQLTGSEDCLYLNIWRPKSISDPLPVYVWIHGGANITGTSSDPTCDGAALAARNDFVVVSLNYRLGPMGWFAHPALRTGEDHDSDSGNFGTLDIIKALEWIRENISAFGGAPDRVTIAGESAGAANVLSLLTSERARGLFHGAVVQSGYTRLLNGHSSMHTLAEADEYGNSSLLNALIADKRADGATEAQALVDGMTAGEIRNYLKSKTAPEIYATYAAMPLGSALGWFRTATIYQDGNVLPANGWDSFSDGSYANKVPLIIGSNKEELKLFLASLFAEPTVFDSDPALYQATCAYTSDLFKLHGVDEVIRALGAHPGQPDIYAYQFNWGGGGESGQSVLSDPFGFLFGAFHTLEIPFFFYHGNYPVPGILTDDNAHSRIVLSDAITSYLYNFARSGDPNNSTPGNLPQWNPWQNTAGAEKLIFLDADIDGNLTIEMSDRELTAEGIEDTLDMMDDSTYTGFAATVRTIWSNISNLIF